MGALFGGIEAVPLLFSSPSAAFALLRERPRWLGLLLLCALSAGIAAWIALPSTLEAEAEIMRDVIERFDMPPEQAEEMMASTTDPEDVGASELAQRVGGGFVATAAVLLIGMLVFHVIARVSGPDPSIRQSASIYFLAATASAAGSLLKGVLIRVSGSIDVTLGPGALFPGLDPTSVTAAFLNVFDLFSVLNLWLLVIGLGVVLGSSRGSAWAIGGAYWVLKSLVVFSMMLFRVWISGNL
jgi:hypothetical protein